MDSNFQSISNPLKSNSIEYKNIINSNSFLTLYSYSFSFSFILRVLIVSGLNKCINFIVSCIELINYFNQFYEI